MSQKFLSRGTLLGETGIVVYFVVAKLIICLFPFEYGFFRDELYYIAMSDNLDFGYIDVPPLVPFLLAVVRSVLGTSFFSLHLLPAISGALVAGLALMTKITILFLAFGLFPAMMLTKERMHFLSWQLFVKYTGRSIWEGIKGERHNLGRLPHHFHDRFGWEEMAKNVESVYDRLSDEDKAKACVLMGNYGEAGASWAFAEEHGLPKPISGHPQYYFWGPRGHSGEVAISMGIDMESLKDHFGDVKKVMDHGCRWAIPYEKYLDVYLCREPRKPLQEMWSNFKHLD